MRSIPERLQKEVTDDYLFQKAAQPGLARLYFSKRGRVGAGAVSS
jgi:hypothetical protein